MGLEHNGVSKLGAAGSGSQGNTAQWILVGAANLMIALLLAGTFFSFSPPWPRILQTVVPMLTLLGLLVVRITKRRNVRTTQRKINEIERALKGGKSVTDQNR